MCRPSDLFFLLSFQMADEFVLDMETEDALLASDVEERVPGPPPALSFR